MVFFAQHHAPAHQRPIGLPNDLRPEIDALNPSSSCICGRGGRRGQCLAHHPVICPRTLTAAGAYTVGSAPACPCPLMQGCQRLLARLPTLTARAVAGKPLGPTARASATHLLRSRGAQQRQCLCAAAQPPSVAPDKMAQSNGGSVTSEEVEQLRAQLETLQVRAMRHCAHAHMPPPACRRLPLLPAAACCCRCSPTLPARAPPPPPPPPAPPPCLLPAGLPEEEGG